MPELLGELSYRGYRETTFDKLLLVEGRTDVKTIHQFLRLYDKAHKIVLVPLGGGEMINAKPEWELSEIARSGDVEVLIDSEKTSKEEDLPRVVYPMRAEWG